MADPSSDHPMSRLTGTIGRLPRYARLARALISDPRLSRPRKAALAAGLAYLVSPIDLVPGFVPVAGQLDDLAVVLFAIRTALRGLPADDAQRHVLAAGLPPTALAMDIANVQAAARWTADSVVRAGRRTLSWSFSVARQVTGATARATRDARRRRRRRVAP